MKCPFCVRMGVRSTVLLKESICLLNQTEFDQDGNRFLVNNFKKQTFLCSNNHIFKIETEQSRKRV